MVDKRDIPIFLPNRERFIVSVLKEIRATVYAVFLSLFLTVIGIMIELQRRKTDAKLHSTRKNLRAERS